MTVAGRQIGEVTRLLSRRIVGWKVGVIETIRAEGVFGGICGDVASRRKAPISRMALRRSPSHGRCVMVLPMCCRPSRQTKGLM